MNRSDATATQVMKSDPSGSTPAHDNATRNNPTSDRDGRLQGKDYDLPDDLEDEQTGREHRNRDAGEGEEGDLTELAAPGPIDRTRTRSDSLEREESAAKDRESHHRESNTEDPEDGDEFTTEVAAPAPIERGGRHRNDDEEKGEGEVPSSVDSPDSQDLKNETPEKRFSRSRLATELYIHSYLIFFSIMGTLARLGIEAINAYPNMTIISPVVWANLAGSFFLGFLTEDRRLFREEWGSQDENWSFHPSKTASPNEGDDSQEDDEKIKEEEEKMSQAKAAHGKVKKTIPLFIGLAIGFCGSFTSFSSFIRDAFLAAVNQPPLWDPPGRTFGATPTIPRSGGYSAEASVAILIVHVALSLCALQVGANVALALDRFMPTLPFRLVRRFIDPLMVLVGIGCWLGAVWLSIWPPTNSWRERATFALVFAPPGCLCRFYASKFLNSRLPTFPLGTFLVNVGGTAVLGLCFDLQHSGAAAASLAGCQVLEGVMEGFCGCLTTVSTWVVELDTLERRHGYVYGLTSVAVALAFLVVIMGSLEWTVGFSEPVC